jgi:hypothetical protein
VERKQCKEGIERNGRTKERNGRKEGRGLQHGEGRKRKEGRGAPKCKPYHLGTGEEGGLSSSRYIEGWVGK